MSAGFQFPVTSVEGVCTYKIDTDNGYRAGCKREVLSSSQQKQIHAIVWTGGLTHYPEYFFRVWITPLWDRKFGTFIKLCTGLYSSTFFWCHMYTTQIQGDSYSQKNISNHSAVLKLMTLKAEWCIPKHGGQCRRHCGKRQKHHQKQQHTEDIKPRTSVRTRAACQGHRQCRAVNTGTTFIHLKQMIHTRN